MDRWHRYWPLLFPCAYLLHLGEEIWGGPGFVQWAAEHLSEGFTDGRFRIINLVAWPAMLITSVVALHVPRARWLVATLASALLVNGMLHLGSAIVTRSYSPGMISGVLLYLPLGVLSLRRIAREVPAIMLTTGLVLGIAVHALVAFVAFALPARQP